MISCHFATPLINGSTWLTNNMVIDLNHAIVLEQVGFIGENGPGKQEQILKSTVAFFKRALTSILPHSSN